MSLYVCIRVCDSLEIGILISSSLSLSRSLSMCVSFIRNGNNNTKSRMDKRSTYIRGFYALRSKITKVIVLSKHDNLIIENKIPIPLVK